jgi:hypothetical protein
MSKHGNGILLVFARTETKWFQKYIFARASGILFLNRRLSFYKVDGTPAEFGGGAPSVLVAYGEDNLKALAESGIGGTLIGGGDV